MSHCIDRRQDSHSRIVLVYDIYLRFFLCLRSERHRLFCRRRIYIGSNILSIANKFNTYINLSSFKANKSSRMCHCIAWSCYSTVHIPIVHIDFNDFLPAFVANVCRQSKQVMSSSRFYAPSVHSAHLFRCICSFLRVACRSCFYLFVSVISAHASRRYNSTDTSIHTHTQTHIANKHTIRSDGSVRV